MTRQKWSLGIGLLLACVVLSGGAGKSEAQSGGDIPNHSLQAVGATDATGTQASTTGFSWAGAWSMGQFGFIRFQSWGLAPARSWSGRTSVAVLRERRGLLR